MEDSRIAFARHAIPPWERDYLCFFVNLEGFSIIASTLFLAGVPHASDSCANPFLIVLCTTFGRIDVRCVACGCGGTIVPRCPGTSDHSRVADSATGSA